MTEINVIVGAAVGEDRDAPQSRDATEVVRACLQGRRRPGAGARGGTVGAARCSFYGALERELASVAPERAPSTAPVSTGRATPARAHGMMRTCPS
jgi:hypothetical protein